jgi:hypothetical protein
MAHSKYFEQQLSSHQSNTSDIVIEGDWKTMDDLIRYLYLQNEADLQECVEQIYRLAVKYEFYTIKVLETLL